MFFFSMCFGTHHDIDRMFLKIWFAIEFGSYPNPVVMTWLRE